MYTDVNECENGGCGCDAMLEIGTCVGSCTNLIGSFQCSCSEGYHIGDDNLLCYGKNKTAIAMLLIKLLCIVLFLIISDTNECLNDNGGCACNPLLLNSSCEASCVNSNGSFTCNCNEGYELSGDSNTECSGYH